MLKANAPIQLSQVFAAGSGAGPVNTIPNTPSGTSGTVSYQTGFTSVNMTPIASGGIPPFGADMNGLWQAQTTAQIWEQAGYIYPYNSTFSTGIGGYPNGALVQSNTSGFYGYWLSTADNNTTNPDSTANANWLPIPVNGGISAITGLTGGTVTLTKNQLGAPLITLAGTLTSNCQVILGLPTGATYTIQNNTTGSYTLTVGGATGTAVTIAQGTTNGQTVYCDGTNWYTGQFNGSGVYLPIAGTAVAANKLAVARTIAMTGPVTWSVSFDGSANVTAASTIGAGQVTLANLANMTANSLLGNPTGSAAAPSAITLTNGLQFSGTALGMGNITPAKVSATPTTAPTPTTAGGGAASLAYQAIGAFGGGYALNDSGAGYYWGLYDTSGALTFGYATTSTGALATVFTLTTTGVTSAGSISGTVINASGLITGAASIHITGNTITNAQGTWLGWNKQPTVLGTTFNGEMDFINHHGGGSGGYAFWDTANGTSFTCYAFITATGNIYATPSAANPANGIAPFGFVASGSYGGGLGILDGTYSWGIYDVSGTLYFGAGTGATGALTARMTLTSAGALGISAGLTCTTMNATSSDETLKENFIEKDPIPMHRVWFGEYDRKDVTFHGRGTTAQKLQKFMPQHVHEYDYKAGNTPNSVIKKLSIAVADAAFEQSIWCGRQIDNHEARIAALEARL